MIDKEKTSNAKKERRYTSKHFLKVNSAYNSFYTSFIGFTLNETNKKAKENVKELNMYLSIFIYHLLPLNICYIGLLQIVAL